MAATCLVFPRVRQYAFSVDLQTSDIEQLIPCSGLASTKVEYDYYAAPAWALYAFEKLRVISILDGIVHSGSVSVAREFELNR
jgi:hypothetical protein